MSNEGVPDESKMMINSPEGRAAAEHARLVALFVLRRDAPEKAVMFHALLPKVLALVSAFKVELDHVLVVALSGCASESPI